MIGDQWTGLWAVIAGGVCQGSFMLPMNRSMFTRWKTVDISRASLTIHSRKRITPYAQ